MTFIVKFETEDDSKTPIINALIDIVKDIAQYGPPRTFKTLRNDNGKNIGQYALKEGVS